MHKIRFRGLRENGNWDGSTLPPDTYQPTWGLVGGFEQADLPDAVVGRLPAGLYGKAPAGDPYLLIATMWTGRHPATSDVVGVDTRVPVRTRDRWNAHPGNTHVSLVRPDDTITFAQVNDADESFLELLLEPLADTNEFGQVLIDYVREATELRRLVQETETDLVVTGNHTLSNWAGTLRVRVSAGAAVVLTLPDPNRQQLRDLLMVEMDTAQPVQLLPPNGIPINGQPNTTLTTNNNTVSIRGARGRYNLCGVL